MVVIWSRLARETLAEILQYVEEHFNTKTAQSVMKSIIEYTNLLSSFPRIGFEDLQLSTDMQHQ